MNEFDRTEEYLFKILVVGDAGNLFPFIKHVYK